MALAMGCEVLRTHYDRLVLNRLSWKDRVGSWEQDNTQWL